MRHHRRLIYPLLLALLLLAPVFVRATHIVGAEMYYDYLGNNNYEIYLIVYRDCGPNNVNGTGFDANAPVGIFTSNGGLFDVLDMDLFDAEVDFVPVTLANPCFILPDDVCIERAIYTQTVNLPFNAGGYSLVYQRCCFGAGVTNLDNSDDTGITATTTIPGTDLVDEPNSSAVFDLPTPAAMCLGAEFFYDSSATDPDGDELVYTFCNAYNGGTPMDPAPNPPDNPPFTPVDYGAGFNSGYPIASNPAFEIDPVTGFMTGTANQLGTYLVAVCVEEYRDGVLISSHSRVFQYRVTTCDPNIVASIPEQIDFCSGLTVTFENESTNASSYFWDFGFPGIDSDTSNLVSPTYTYPDSGSFTIMLVANPGWPCADTAYTSYAVLPVIEPDIIVEEALCINDQMTYSFAVDANASPFAVYAWTFGAGAIPAASALESPQNIILNSEEGVHTITVTVTDNGCVESDTEIIDNPPDPVAGITPQNSFCNGLTYTFGNESVNATSYDWDFGTPIGGDSSDDENPEWTFPDPGLYIIQLIAEANGSCPDTTTMEFEIFGDLNPFFEEPDPQCFSTNSFDFTGLGATTNDAQYVWFFGTNQEAGSSTAPNPQNVNFPEPGNYDVTLQISENGCTEAYTGSLWVVEDPTLIADPEPVQGCPDLTVFFQCETTSETQTFYEWTFGDGTTATSQNPVHVYTQPGTYDVTVTAYTVSACVASNTLSFPQLVMVNPVPVPGFVIEPQTVNILEPFVTVTDSSQNSVSCLYVMSDGGQSEECDFDYAWTEAGRQYIVQYVFNEFGCSASTIGYVNVEGFLFYAPNTFTPNNDGINEAWLPEMTGVTKYHLQIFNRWGDLIFETEDPTEAWTGSAERGDYFCPDGTYLYRIQLSDLLLYPHEVEGHILLVR